MRGILFADLVTGDERDTVLDWGLVMSRKIIGTPKLKYKSVTLPDRDGELDYTDALFGVPLYENRTLEFTFEYLDNPQAWTETFKDIRNFLHGRKVKLYDPDDSGMYYHVGRVEVGDPSGGLVKIFNVKVSANPWKLKASGETVVTVEATPDAVITLTNDWKPVIPTIMTDDLVSIQFGNTIYTMDGSGTFKFPKMLLRHGSNTMTVVSGTANLTFTYQEGAI
jgi:hypothetical protein